MDLGQAILIDHFPHDFAGDQLQITALKGIFFRIDALDQLKKLKEQRNITIILLSHRMEDMALYAERLIVMRRGTVAMDGTPEEIFSRPGELQDIGLDIPGAAALALELRARGMELPGAIYTPRQLAAALLSRRGGAAC